MIRAYLYLLGMLALIFVSAGRLNYWQGWLFGATYLVSISIVFILFADKKDLLRERTKPGPGIKWWDRIFFALYIPLAFSVFVVAALDAGRFKYSAGFPLCIYVMSYVIFILSYSVVIWAMFTNKFFSSAVRIQTERGHYVIQAGPYRFVRHPAYLAAIFLFVSTSLVLGSLLAIIPAVVTSVLIVIRTYLEDSTLRKELPGYADYAEKVRFRLLPGIW